MPNSKFLTLILIIILSLMSCKINRIKSKDFTCCLGNPKQIIEAVNIPKNIDSLRILTNVQFDKEGHIKKVYIYDSIHLQKIGIFKNLKSAISLIKMVDCSHDIPCSSMLVGIVVESKLIRLDILDGSSNHSNNYKRKK